VPVDEALPTTARFESNPAYAGPAGGFAAGARGVATHRGVRGSPMAELVDLRKVDVSSPEILGVTTGQWSEVTFAIQDLDRQLRLVAGHLRPGPEMNKAIAAVDLSVRE